MVMVVKLYNANDELLAFHCELRATANGKDLERPIVFDGYVNSKTDTSLIVEMDNVPNPIAENVLSIDARMRYNVSYYFPKNKQRTRRTSKFVQWTGQYPASGME